MYKWFKLMNSFHIVLITSGLKSAVATMFSRSLRILPYSGEMLPPIQSGFSRSRELW